MSKTICRTLSDLLRLGLALLALGAGFAVAPAHAQIPTTVTVSVGPNPSQARQPLYAEITVSPVTAVGSAYFTLGNYYSVAATVARGRASVSMIVPLNGTYQLRAHFVGGNGYGSSTSQPIVQVVQPLGPALATTTALSTTPNPGSVGQYTVLTADVKPATAFGAVTFKDGDTTLGTLALSNGKASLSVKFASAGVHNVSASYAGAAGYLPSTSAIWAQTIVGTAAAPTSTSTALTSSVNPSTPGQPTLLTASVIPAPASGAVTFRDGAALLGTAMVSAGGKATLSASLASAGTHSLSAAYEGSASHRPSTSAPLVQTVLPTVTLPAAPASPAPTVRHAYDPEGNRISTTSAPDTPELALQTTTSFDGQNQARASTDPAGSSVQLDYDGLGQLSQVTDPRKLTTQTPRNAWGQSTQQRSPDSGTTAYVYDLAGNLTQSTDARGAAASHSYDPLNRRSASTYTLAGQSSQTFGWIYDQTGSDFGQGIGRLTTASFHEGNIQYAYDAHGRITQARQTLQPAAGANSAALTHTVGYAYDAVGRVTSTTYPSGRQALISYASGRPSSISLSAGGTPVPLLAQLQYAPFGPLENWNWITPLGPVAATRSHDQSGRLMRYSLGPYLRDLRYDAANRITGVTHYQSTAVSGQVLAQPSLDQQYSYDRAGRLTQVTGSGTQRWSYTYDASGNRTSIALDGTAAAPYTIDAASNRMLASTNPPITLRYDAAGHAIGDNNFALSYDARGRLATVSTGGQSYRYTHDSAGLRVRKSNGTAAGTAVFVYDQNSQLLGEYDAAGKPIREYVWLDDQPVAVFMPDPANAQNPPLIYFIHADHINTPRVVTDRQTNAVRWTWWSEPFGTTQAQGNPGSLGNFTLPLRFPGQYFDGESGMHYNVNRDYMPGSGRYAQSDPIGLAGGINTYAYVKGNPLSLVDPEGLRGGPPSPGTYYPRGLPPQPLPRSDLPGRAAYEAGASMTQTPNPGYPGAPLDLPCTQWDCSNGASCGPNDIKYSSDFLPPATSTADAPKGCRCISAGRDPAFQLPFDPNVDPYSNAKDVRDNWGTGTRWFRR